MTSSKRSDIFSRILKVLAKRHKPIKPVERPVLECLLYADCLEDSRPEQADECFARLQESFFDWNEVRVTTVAELAEVLRGLHDPQRTATLIKQTLHSVFESIYDFDLEPLRKQNLGAAIKHLQGYRGTTPFSVNYVVQATLGGHAIPVSRAGMDILQILGVVTEAQIGQGVVPGLERAIAKNKGQEFASLLQQFAAEFAAAPYHAETRAVLLEIEPDAKTRLPKRAGRKSPADEPESAPTEVAEKPPKAAAKPAAKSPAKKTPAEKKPAEKKPVDKKPAASGTNSKKKNPPPKTDKPIAKKASGGAKKSTSKQLARRKPR